MIYHLFNAKVPGMSNIDRFRHAVTVRNRTLGPGAATTPSPHLDLEISDDNRTMLTLSPDDINMNLVLQQSSCKHGRRRKVAKRALNALGGVSGLCGFLNDTEQVREITANLKFVQSLEEVRAAEKNLKARKAKEARKKFYDQACAKCGVQQNGLFYKHHVKKLTCAQMKAVCFVQCGGLIINGKAPELKMKLTKLLDYDVPGVPDYETQDDYCDPDVDAVGDEDSDGSTSISIDLPIENMNVDDCVDVWWKGDKCWYSGRITDVDLESRTFEVFYFLDEHTLVHHDDEYNKVRMAC